MRCYKKGCNKIATNWVGKKIDEYTNSLAHYCDEHEPVHEYYGKCEETPLQKMQRLKKEVNK